MFNRATIQQQGAAVRLFTLLAPPMLMSPKGSACTSRFQYGVKEVVGLIPTGAKLPNVFCAFVLVKNKNDKKHIVIIVIEFFIFYIFINLKLYV
jgi:hypothetical protein